MPARLLIRFHPQPEKNKEVDWLLFNSDLGFSEAGRGLLQDIPKPLDETFVIVLVPSLDVLMLEVVMPHVKQSQLRKMVPFAIEDYLTRDLAELHVALGGGNAEGKWVVTIVDHVQMKAWLDMLKEADLHADSLVPDLWYFPWEEGVWFVWIESGLAWVKTGKSEGFVADVVNLEMLMDLKCKELEQGQKVLPTKIEMTVADDSVSHEFLSQMQTQIQKNIPLQVEEKKAKTSFLSIIAKYLPGKLDFTLLQPPYGVKKKWGKLKKQWFPVFLLFIVWFSFFLFKHLFEFFYLKHQNTVLERKMLSSYQQLFPSVQDLEVSKQRLQAWVERTTKVARGEPFLRKLNQLAPLIKSASVQLVGFDYRDSEWLLKIQSKDFEALNSFMQLLKNNGIKFIKKSALQKNDKVVSQLIMK